MQGDAENRVCESYKPVDHLHIQNVFKHFTCEMDQKNRLHKLWSLQYDLNFKMGKNKFRVEDEMSQRMYQCKIVKELEILRHFVQVTQKKQANVGRILEKEIRQRN